MKEKEKFRKYLLLNSKNSEESPQNNLKSPKIARILHEIEVEMVWF
jgi:hypothetical protein